MERPDRLRSGRQLLANQPYDESLEADDVDEFAGTYSHRQVKNRRLRGAQIYFRPVDLHTLFYTEE